MLRGSPVAETVPAGVKPCVWLSPARKSESPVSAGITKIDILFTPVVSAVPAKVGAMAAVGPAFADPAFKYAAMAAVLVKSSKV